jgi:hypothetical protein
LNFAFAFTLKALWKNKIARQSIYKFMGGLKGKIKVPNGNYRYRLYLIFLGGRELTAQYYHIDTVVLCNRS